MARSLLMAPSNYTFKSPLSLCSIAYLPSSPKFPSSLWYPRHPFHTIQLASSSYAVSTCPPLPSVLRSTTFYLHSLTLAIHRNRPEFPSAAFQPSVRAATCLGGIRCSGTYTPHREAELIVAVQTEDSLLSTVEIQAVVEQLERDGPLALKQALDNLEDIEPVEAIELSVVICHDRYIQKLNKEWLGEDCPTDVLSFPQDQPANVSSTLLLGDVIISVETAVRQAGERGYSLIDEMRILLVHGLLHLLGYDHEEDLEAAKEMEEQESHILTSLGWKGKGLISASFEDAVEDAGGMAVSVAEDSKIHGAGSRPIWQNRPPFSVLFCDMDGTLLNSKSQITAKTAGALKAVIARGVKVIIATGKSRPAAITALQPVGLVGENGAVSSSLPGVFLQGLLVYGKGGGMLHDVVLLPDICAQAFKFSIEENKPLVAFSGDRVVTLFDHPSIEELHVVYKEPKAEVIHSVDYIVNKMKVQKLLFTDSREGITNFLRPYWSHATEGRARVVQAIDYMLEIIPEGASKGKGVELLLDHLEIYPDDVMAIGDGENDIEMLELVGWGVAMANGSPQTLAIADAHVSSNDEDGVVEAVERFILG